MPRTVQATTQRREVSTVTILINHHPATRCFTMFSPKSMKLIRDNDEQRLLFQSPGRPCALLNDGEEFSLLASPMFPSATTAVPGAGAAAAVAPTADSSTPNPSSSPESQSNSTTRKSDSIRSRPCSKETLRLSPQEHAQTMLVPLYEQVQDLLVHQNQPATALHCILQALLGAYQHALHIHSEQSPHADEYLQNMRNSLAGLWVLLAHAWLEVLGPRAALAILHHVVTHCPVIGNHGWLSTACARLSVLSENNHSTEDLQQPQDYCWDGLDRAHGRSFDERVPPPPLNLTKDLQHIMSQQEPPPLELLFHDILALAVRLRNLERKSFYTFTDTKAAGLLCQELNRLSAFERRHERSGKHAHPEQQQNFPVSPVDAYPLLNQDLVYPPMPPSPPKPQLSQSREVSPPINLAADGFPTVRDDDHDISKLFIAHRRLAHFTADNNYGYVVSPPVHVENGALILLPSPSNADISSGKKRRISMSTSHIKSNHGGFAASGVVVTVQPPPIQGKHILPRPKSMAEVMEVEEEAPSSPNAMQRWLAMQESLQQHATSIANGSNKKKKYSHKKSKKSNKHRPRDDQDLTANTNLDEPQTASKKTKKKKSSKTKLSKSPRKVSNHEDYWMKPDWEPKDDSTGQLVHPDVIRREIMEYIETTSSTKTRVLSQMRVNSNSFRKFMDVDRYKEEWRATENGTYWAAARLLEAYKNGRDGMFQNDPNLNTKILFTDRQQQHAGGDDISDVERKSKKRKSKYDE